MYDISAVRPPHRVLRPKSMRKSFSSSAEPGRPNMKFSVPFLHYMVSAGGGADVAVTQRAAG